MDYIQAREFIDNAYKKGSIYGLDSIRALVEAVNRPQESLRIIHIAGTNGKGSVGTFISEVLREAGYKVGRYVSPTVYCYDERFQINGKNIPHDRFAQIMSRVAAAKDKIKFDPTGFELETAAALLYFKEEGCDTAVIECGLGGKTDATNVIDNNMLTIFTSISLDHTALLGSSVEEIAEEKCGIIKQGGRVVSIEQNPSAERVIKSCCKKLNASLSIVSKKNILNKRVCGFSQYFDYGKYKNVEINMLGSYQYENASLALECIESLKTMGFSIPLHAVYSGMKRAHWGARFEIVNTSPVFVLDGAHNPDAAKRLRDSLEIYFKNQKKLFIIGVFLDKDYDGILKNTAGLAEQIFTVKPPSARGLAADKLAAAARKYNDNVKASDIHSAVDYCMGQKDCVTVAFGSLSFMGLLTDYISNGNNLRLTSSK